MGIEYKSKDKCRLVVYAGSDAYGKPKRFYKTVKYTSKRNAEKQYRAFEQEVIDGLTKDTSVRVSVMIDDYIASRKRKGLRSTTLHGYEVIKDRIDKTLGDPIASKVSRKMIDDWIGGMDEDYSSKTIRNTVTFLSACYERYVDLEQLEKNPCKRADIPEKPPKERIILTQDDIKPFYDALCKEWNDQPDFVAAIELMLFCGLRRSEVLGLKPQSVDMINRTIHIEDARHRIGSESVMEGTKTTGSNRVLALPEFLFDDIMDLISIHEKNARADKNLPDPEYLILGAWGEPVHPSVIYTALKRFEKKYDLPDVSLHGLRHTYASMLKWLGRDLVEISPQLGHTQQSTTLNIYTHLFKSASASSRSIASELDRMVSGEQFTPNSPSDKAKAPEMLIFQGHNGGERGI